MEKAFPKRGVHSKSRNTELQRNMMRWAFGSVILINFKIQWGDMSINPPKYNSNSENRISRRTFLKYMGAAGAVFTLSTKK
jgi:hypothetical protein